MLKFWRHRVRWLVVAWVFVMSTVAILDRVNISIDGSFIEHEFHFTHTQLGWVFSAFLVGYALFQVPTGHIADLYGARWALAGGALW